MKKISFLGFAFFALSGLALSACTDKAVGGRSSITTPLEGDWQLQQMDVRGNKGENPQTRTADENGFISFSDNAPYKMMIIASFRAYTLKTTFLNNSKSVKTSKPEVRQIRLEGNEIVMTNNDKESRVVYSIEDGRLILRDSDQSVTVLRRITEQETAQFIKTYGNFREIDEIGSFEVSYQGKSSTGEVKSGKFVSKPTQYYSGDAKTPYGGCIHSKESKAVYITLRDGQGTLSLDIKNVESLDQPLIFKGGNQGDLLLATIFDLGDLQYSSFSSNCEGILGMGENGIEGGVKCSGMHGYSSTANASSTADVQVRISHLECSTQ